MDKIMFNEYIDKAMHHAHYKQLEDGTWFGRIPGFKGVWANQLTEQECQKLTPLHYPTSGDFQATIFNMLSPLPQELWPRFVAGIANAAARAA